jgi:anti-sigma factor RsiW
MICDEIRQSFDDYLDDELSARARHQVERHVTRCDSCRAELAELRSLIEAAQGLDLQTAPDHDLWPAIAARLENEVTVETPWWLRLAAAGIALAILSLPLSVWWLGRSDESARSELQSEQPIQPLTVQAELARAEDGVQLPRTDLVTAIERRRDVVPDDTLHVLEENMMLLDRAIGETRAALDDDPQNLSLRMLLAARYQQERKLLQKVSRV